MEGLSGGQTPWQDEVKTGTSPSSNTVVREAERDAGLGVYRRRGVDHFMNNHVGGASMTDQILGNGVPVPRSVTTISEGC